MSTDTLDSLSDSDLNERFARQVVQATQIEEAPGTWRFYGDTRHQWTEGPLPDYCGSADAVMPWVDQGSVECHRLHRYDGRGRQWQVEVWPDRWYRGCGVADTFARAAVIALLRATAASNGGESS